MQCCAAVLTVIALAALLVAWLAGRGEGLLVVIVVVGLLVWIQSMNNAGRIAHPWED